MAGRRDSHVSAAISIVWLRNHEAASRATHWPKDATGRRDDRVQSLGTAHVHRVRGSSKELSA